MFKLLFGVIAASIVTIIAYKKKSLSLSGSIAAVILGTGIYGLGGEIPFTLMMIFFISSSILSKLKKKKKKFLDSMHEKGDARDYMQVIANGGVALVLLILYKITANPVYFVATAVSFAASNADTWASEVGVLSKGKTISILTGKKIEKGVSGGISLLGTVASFCGSATIAVSYVVLNLIIIGKVENALFNILIITVIGFIGSIIDSILGVTIQAQYIDKKSGKITEKKNENLVKGFSVINNDIVNLISNLLATLIAIIIIYI